MDKNSMKNRNREPFTFANINLLGKCNVDCYFCLGKDLEPEVKGINNLRQYFWKDWKNLYKFLRICRLGGISKLYITGQNADSLQYEYIQELIETLKTMEFKVGIRTNGYLALQTRGYGALRMCNDEVGYSIHSLKSNTNAKIIGRKDIPDWDKILPLVDNTRVSIVVNRYNIEEIDEIIKYVSTFDNVRYIQLRKISTDFRQEMLKEDMILFEVLYRRIKEKFSQKDSYYGAEIFEIHGKDVVFWRTVSTSVNSMNYFTDGTISENYFVVEGYLQNKDSREQS